MSENTVSDTMVAASSEPELNSGKALAESLGQALEGSTVQAGQDGEATTDDRSPTVVEKFVIRLPNGLRDQIRSLSEQNRRSMNSEIIMVLENHIRQKFMDQMSAANPDGNFKAGERNTELELSRRLENLPAEKKEALLELLG
jgi:hypothetical protein